MLEAGLSFRPAVCRDRWSPYAPRLDWTSDVENDPAIVPLADIALDSEDLGPEGSTEEGSLTVGEPWEADDLSDAVPWKTEGVNVVDPWENQDPTLEV